MPSYVVDTPQRKYCAIVERGILERVGEHIPAAAGRAFRGYHTGCLAATLLAAG